MNNSILPIYKILFQIIRQYDTIQDDKEFVSQMKIFFLDKSKIGDYLRSTVSQCDFSFKNVTLIKKLCKVYRISSIDSGWIGKLCQTTGIVSFLIRDCLKYCGLVDEVEKRNKETSSSFPGKTILKGLFQFQKMRKRKEKILRRLEVTINNTSS